MNWARLLAHVHGHIGWLAAAALLHPALILRDRRRRADAAVASGPLLASLTACLGFIVYGPYRERVRRPLFAETEAWGWMFERKEHVAFAAVALAWAGALAYAGALRADDAVRAPLRIAAHRAFVAASALAIVAATLGTCVAAVRGL